MAEQEWYYAVNGRQLGPVDLDTLRQLLAQQNVQPSDLVWRQGMNNWQPAGSVAECGSSEPTIAPIPVAVYPATGAGPAPYGTPGQPAPPAPLPYATATTSSQGRATTAFVISLLGFFCFGIVLGPISIYLAVRAKANMAQSGDFTGHGLASAALVIGIVDIFVFLLGVAIQLGVMHLR